MNITDSIISGRILSLLEEQKQPISMEGLMYYLEESYDVVRRGVERLIKDGLAVLDVEEGFLKLTAMPDLDYVIKKKKKEVIGTPVCV